jgi:peptide/nickel transport system substrate-binding protein
MSYVTKIVVVSVLLLSVAIAYGGEKPKPTGTVKVAIGTFGKEVMDISLDGSVGLPYHGEMFDWFIGATPDGKLSTKYGVLESYKSNADATAYTFALKKGIKWHDGVEMTSDDIKFSLEHFKRPDSACTQCGAMRKNLARVKVIDRYTATMYLKKADVNIPAAFGPLEGNFKILPKHHFDKVGVKGFNDNPLGSGPWKFVSRRIGEFIEYEANTDYWNSGRIPGFAKLRVVLAPEARTRMAMLKRGEVDVAALNSEHVKPLRADGFRITGANTIGYPMILFYGSYNPEFITHKLEIRKALTLALNIKELVAAYYPSEVARPYEGGTLFFSPVTMGYDPNLPPYPYDPEEAKRLLKQAGYKGETVKFWNFLTSANPEQLEMNEVIASSWRDIGVNVELIPIDFGAFRPNLKSEPQTLKPPAHIGSHMAWARPSVVNNWRVFLISHAAGGSLATGWNPKKIDKYWAEVSAIVDPDKREKRLLEINRDLYDEYWGIPIAIRNQVFGLGARVKDWQPTSGTPTDLCFETLKPAQ